MPACSQTEPRTRDLVRVAERDALPHQPFGNIGRERESLRRQERHPVGVELNRRDHTGEGREDDFEGLHGVEDGLLVFLQIAGGRGVGGLSALRGVSVSR